MSYLLDTMVVSERIKSRPDSNVLAWMAVRRPIDFSISVLTIGEILYGIRRLPAARRARLERWLNQDVPAMFADRILAVDLSVARAWANLRIDAARSLSHVDSLIAATAAAHSLIVVTRNERDFADLGVAVENPWR